MPGPWENYQQPQTGAGPWTKYGAPPPAAPPQAEPGFLDKEIPLSSYGNATLSGVQSIGRGFRGVGQALRHPIDAIKSIGDLPGQVGQVPGAIRDINASPDPVGTYAKVGQETAGQGAAQALTGAATEGLIRGVPRIASAAKPVVRAGLRTAAEAVDPDVTGIVSPRLAHAQRLAGRLADKMAPKPVFPGAHLPEAPPVFPGAPLPEHPGVFPGAHLPENPGVFPGAHLPEHPGVFPGAPLPEAPPPEAIQARPLATIGQKPAPPPAAALGRIPVRSETIPPRAPYPPEAPTVIAKPKPVQLSPERARFLEDKGTQEQIRDAAESEDRTRLSIEKREWFARNQPGSTKGELTGAPEKPVKFTKTPGVGVKPGTKVPAPDEDLTPILKKSLAAARKKGD